MVKEFQVYIQKCYLIYRYDKNYLMSGCMEGAGGYGNMEGDRPGMEEWEEWDLHQRCFLFCVFLASMFLPWLSQIPEKIIIIPTKERI